MTINHDAVAGGWRLVGEGKGVRTVAEGNWNGEAVQVVIDGKVTAFDGSLEEAVRQTPQLRTLAPGMEWSLTTDLDDWTAVTLLGRPVEEVEGVEINGHEWETASDDSGPFLMPTSYQFDDRILTVLMKFDLDDDYDQAYCFNRVGPLCQLWNYAWWEAGETQHIIHEPDDLAAVERFAADLREAGKLGGCAGHGRPGWPARRRRARPAHSCARRLGPRLAPRMVAR